MAALDLASESISTAGGTVLRYAGDAILAEFASTVKLVLTAMTIQNRLAGQNADLAEDDKIRLRIGLNLGEVMQDRG